ncbi:DUF1194 domain-containing protein [Lichenibacterium dinghuense]|uniref:DUF1194 domain-containing protein n=1 Tax=Lichenibacterium dinghuense TaxID=2895977 RepID=UPI001F2F9996|nr:DUF1194 domain-containing protein [Lichenibacterium sp. 6Y81]
MERRTVLNGVAALLGGAVLGPARASAAGTDPATVDLMLVLAADVSHSITDEKYELQRKGYAAAMSDPDVLRAIAAGTHGRIAVSFVEWAGSQSQKLVIPWTGIGGPEEARGFGLTVGAAPRSFSDRTAIGSAIDFSAALFAEAPFQAERRVIDVSGDGDSNGGSDIEGARDAALAHGVTAINGIVILSDMSGPAYLVAHTHPPGGLQEYYRRRVTGGLASFVAVAEDFDSFGRALVRKLVQEIS